MTTTDDGMVTETQELSICTDCLFAAAYGADELEGGPDVLYWDPQSPPIHELSGRERERWTDDPDAQGRAAAAYVAACDRNWPGWDISPGCSAECEWCHGGRAEVPCEAAGCDGGEIETDDEWTDCTACDGRGYTLDDSYSVDQCEPTFSWSACQMCGCSLGGDRHAAVATRRKDGPGS